MAPSAVSSRLSMTTKMIKRIKFPKNELNFDYTFNGGQAFRWKYNEKDDLWTGIFAHRVWTLRQHEDHILYEVYKHSTSQDEDDGKLLEEYLRLDEPLTDLYEEWAKSDPIFEKSAKKFTGVRILRQDPIEIIFTFICSSNNNILRIKSMVEKLCSFYGDKITTLDGIEYYDFPRVEKLTEESVLNDLKRAAFGYRSKFIHESAKRIVELGGKDWIHQLEKLPYPEVKTELMKLSGIGAKVADCICLMSFNHLQAIPVDTHVFQIATKYYLPHLKNSKSVTERVYNEIGDHFRSLFGKYAGWPHSVLFCNELKVFQDSVDGKRKKNRQENGKKSKRN